MDVTKFFSLILPLTLCCLQGCGSSNLLDFESKTAAEGFWQPSEKEVEKAQRKGVQAFNWLAIGTTAESDTASVTWAGDSFACTTGKGIFEDNGELHFNASGRDLIFIINSEVSAKLIHQRDDESVVVVYQKQSDDPTVFCL